MNSLAKVKSYLTGLYPESRFQIESFLKSQISNEFAKCLLKYTAPISGHGARLIKGKRSQCHDNAKRLIGIHAGWGMWYGLALSNDQIWRVHSWCRNTQGRIIETTEARIKYYGLQIGGPKFE